MKNKLQDEIIEIFEDNGFTIGDIEEQHDGSYCVELNQSTPLGEDWWVCLVFDKPANDHQTLEELFIEAFEKYTYNFDVNEEAEIYIDCRGKNGVPNSIKDLIEDAQWKNQTLLDTLYALKHDTEDYPDADDEDEPFTITIQLIDDQTVQVESDEIAGEPVKFEKITDPKEQALIALASFLGFEPAEVLNLDGIKKVEAAAGKEPWKIFYIGDLHGLQEVMSYTIRGEGEDEERVTKQDLAFQFGCTPQEIIVKVEMR